MKNMQKWLYAKGRQKWGKMPGIREALHKALIGNVLIISDMQKKRYAKCPAERSGGTDSMAECTVGTEQQGYLGDEDCLNHVRFIAKTV